jgi:hypothetical protein
MAYSRYALFTRDTNEELVGSEQLNNVQRAIVTDVHKQFMK